MTVYTIRRGPLYFSSLRRHPWVSTPELAVRYPTEQRAYDVLFGALNEDGIVEPLVVPDTARGGER